MSDDLELPATEKMWENMVKVEGLTGKTIHEERLVSASKFELRHFLLLRVLWLERIDVSDFRPKDYDLEQWMKPAKKMLQEYDSWSNYRRMLRGKYRKGNFFSARKSQLDSAKVTSNNTEAEVFLEPISSRTRAQEKQRSEATASPLKSKSMKQSKATVQNLKSKVQGLKLDDSDGDAHDGDASDSEVVEGLDTEDTELDFQTPVLTPGSRGPRELWAEMYPKADDEQIVNMAIINFLQALTEHFDSVSSSWTAHRRPFKAQFKDAKYEARVDGYLQGKQRSEVRSLIEVKSALRDMGLAEIRMQESAQMVAWLKESPQIPRAAPFRRFHVSQDRNEIFLIFAEYDSKYLDYLKQAPKKTEDPGFLTMHEIGPYNTTNEDHMVTLGPILLALTLRADADRVKEQNQNVH